MRIVLFYANVSVRSKDGGAHTATRAHSHTGTQPRVPKSQRTHPRHHTTWRFAHKPSPGRDFGTIGQAQVAGEWADLGRQLAAVRFALAD